MKACGIVVEYNPFHNGHLYHLQQAKEQSKSDCIIAVMSGSFLQRGEPAIIDKFHRAKAALFAGADLVIELPYAYAVQSSDLFAKGALFSLHALHVDSICFGSESGQINYFIDGVKRLQKNKSLYRNTIRAFLDEGFAFPEASYKGYEAIGLSDMDMIQPNNILGFSYVRTIFEYNLPLKPLTIKRIQSGFHEERILDSIASATSIRKELITHGLIDKVTNAMPDESFHQLQQYKEKSSILHTWEHYFPFLHYQVMTMSKKELANIHGVDEGLEHRIKKTAQDAISFQDWIERVKTRRYTQTRLQRLFVHILTNTTKQTIAKITSMTHAPYIRLLGMSKTGQAFLNSKKKDLTIPIITNLNKSNHALLALDEKVTNIYYTVLPSNKRNQLRQQEFQLPIRIGVED